MAPFLFGVGNLISKSLQFVWMTRDARNFWIPFLGNFFKILPCFETIKLNLSNYEYI